MKTDSGLMRLSGNLPMWKSNKVRATYNKALLLDQRRLLLQAWAGYLSAAEHSGTE
ncbi:hypothetical protein D9M71_240420 [compost metagenome]